MRGANGALPNTQRRPTESPQGLSALADRGMRQDRPNPASCFGFAFAYVLPHIRLRLSSFDRCLSLTPDGLFDISVGGLGGKSAP
jgi:hypothetical protein